MRFTSALDDIFAVPSSVRVLRALDGLPEGFGVSAREVARRAGVSHPAVARVLASLADLGLVVRKRSTRGDDFSLNLTHVFVPTLRGLLEEERGLRGDVVRFVSHELSRSGVPVDAYLFGSFVWGEMSPTSDVDLALICRLADKSRVEANAAALGDAFRARYGNHLHILIKTTLKPLFESWAEGFRGPGTKLWMRIIEEGTQLPVRTAKTSTRA